MSVCLSISMRQISSQCMDFHEIRHLSIFLKHINNNQVSLKSYNNTGYFTWRPIYILGHISLSSS
jgi:hypothetical protein